MSAIPRWAKGVLKPGDLQKVAEAVGQAEKICGAELVPVIVRRSSGIGHVGFSAGVVALLSLYYARLNILPIDPSSWRPLPYSLGEALAAGLIGWLLSHLAFVQRLFTPRHDREQAVDRRARLEFYKHHVENTASGNGVLLFVSLMERKAVLLCGKGLAAKVPGQAWDEVVKLMAQGARGGALGEGMVAAIAKSAEIVKRHAPARKKIKNELPDRLIVKE